MSNFYTRGTLCSKPFLWLIRRRPSYKLPFKPSRLRVQLVQAVVQGRRIHHEIALSCLAKKKEIADPGERCVPSRPVRVRARPPVLRPPVLRRAGAGLAARDYRTVPTVVLSTPSLALSFLSRLNLTLSVSSFGLVPPPEL